MEKILLKWDSEMRYNEVVRYENWLIGKTRSKSVRASDRISGRYGDGKRS